MRVTVPLSPRDWYVLGGPFLEADCGGPAFVVNDSTRNETSGESPTRHVDIIRSDLAPDRVILPE